MNGIGGHGKKAHVVVVQFQLSQKPGKVNGGNFGHGVIHGHNSNKRKIRIYFT